MKRKSKWKLKDKTVGRMKLLTVPQQGPEPELGEASAEKSCSLLYQYFIRDNVKAPANHNKLICIKKKKNQNRNGVELLTPHAQT